MVVSLRLFKQVLIAVSLATGSAMAHAPIAFAHARLVSSEPAHQAALKGAPKVLHLTFNSLVERHFARFDLVDRAGKSRKIAYTPAKPGQTRDLSVALPPLSPGAHRLKWSVVSADGHRIEGTIDFSVR